MNTGHEALNHALDRLHAAVNNTAGPEADEVQAAIQNVLDASPRTTPTANKASEPQNRIPQRQRTQKGQKNENTSPDQRLAELIYEQVDESPENVSNHQMVLSNVRTRRLAGDGSGTGTPHERTARNLQIPVG